MTADLDQVFVDLYVRCMSNPSLPVEGGPDAARVFCIDMERLLLKMEPRDRAFLILMSQGYGSSEIAEKMGVCERTANHLKKRLFWEPKGLTREM